MDAGKTSIDYAAVLADLLERRAAIDAMIEGTRKILGMSHAAQPQPDADGAAATTVDEHTFFGMGIGDAAVKYLRIAKRAQSLKEIADALDRGGLTHSSTNFGATVHTTLARRAKAVGDVVKVKRKWGLKEWFPGLKIKKADETQDRGESDKSAASS